MGNLLQSAILLGLWVVQGSHGRFLPEPTQRPHIADLDRPPAPTQIAKRQKTSDVFILTIATDETCGFLSGRPGTPITCQNHHTCMWVSSLGIFCGEPEEDIKKWQVHVRCYDRKAALNPNFCNDTCQKNIYNLRW